MRVALISRYPRTPDRPQGGVEAVTVVLVRALARLPDLEVHVLALERGAHRPQVEMHDGATVHRLPGSAWPQMLDIIAGPGRRRLLRCLRQLQPDVVHSHETYGLLLGSIGLPHVFTVHGFDHKNLLANADRWGRLRSQLWRRLEKFGFARQQKIISINPYVRQSIEPLTSAAIVEIENPVDERFFAVQPHPERGRFLCTGWLNERKNTLQTLRAFKLVSARSPDCTLVLAGQAQDPAYHRRITDYVQANALADRVRILGQLDRSALLQELARASCFLLPSLQENAPMAIAEAMAAGLPVVASNRCGMPYMVQEKESGFLVDPENADQIANRLGALLDDDALRERLGRQGREIARERFHPEPVARRTREVYLQAIRDFRSPAPPALRQRVRRWCCHRLARFVILPFTVALSITRFFRRSPRRPPAGQGCRLLLTGRFESENWAEAHLRPLAASPHCAQLVVVSTYPVPPIPKVKTIYPPRWLVQALGRTAARLLVFTWTALRTKPHIVGGFHITVNGLLAAVLGPLIRARSLYVCCGGPIEIADGGIHAEKGGLFPAMETPDAVVERRLLRAVAACDLVVVRGASAVRFFRQRHLNVAMHILTGGFDPGRFQPSGTAPETDLILVGRLTEIKQPDLFLHTVRLVANEIPKLSATIVGDGPLRPKLERLARELGLAHCVRFAGFQPHVGDWLQRARVFVLTSRSEGLSLAMIEAMMCGLPVVVSNVGDLADLVEDGVNGYLVDHRDPAAFARPIVQLLTDPRRYQAVSAAARQASLEHTVEAITRKWGAILATQ